MRGNVVAEQVMVEHKSGVRPVPLKPGLLFGGVLSESNAGDPTSG